jgi:hypothetical protein
MSDNTEPNWPKILSAVFTDPRFQQGSASNNYLIGVVAAACSARKTRANSHERGAARPRSCGTRPKIDPPPAPLFLG